MAYKRLPPTATDKEHEAYEALKEILNELGKANVAADALRKSTESKMSNKIDPVTVLAGVVEAQAQAMQRIVKIVGRTMEELEKE